MAEIRVPAQEQAPESPENQLDTGALLQEVLQISDRVKSGERHAYSWLPDLAREYGCDDEDLLDVGIGSAVLSLELMKDLPEDHPAREVFTAWTLAGMIDDEDKKNDFVAKFKEKAKATLQTERSVQPANTEIQEAINAIKPYTPGNISQEDYTERAKASLTILANAKDAGEKLEIKNRIFDQETSGVDFSTFTLDELRTLVRVYMVGTQNGKLADDNMMKTIFDSYQNFLPVNTRLLTSFLEKCEAQDTDLLLTLPETYLNRCLIPAIYLSNDQERLKEVSRYITSTLEIAERIKEAITMRIGRLIIDEIETDSVGRKSKAQEFADLDQSAQKAKLAELKEKDGMDMSKFMVAVLDQIPLDADSQAYAGKITETCQVFLDAQALEVKQNLTSYVLTYISLSAESIKKGDMQSAKTVLEKLLILLNNPTIGENFELNDLFEYTFIKILDVATIENLSIRGAHDRVWAGMIADSGIISALAALPKDLVDQISSIITDRESNKVDAPKPTPVAAPVVAPATQATPVAAKDTLVSQAGIAPSASDESRDSPWQTFMSLRSLDQSAISTNSGLIKEKGPSMDANEFIIIFRKCANSSVDAAIDCLRALSPADRNRLLQSGNNLSTTMGLIKPESFRIYAHYLIGLMRGVDPLNAYSLDEIGLVVLFGQIYVAEDNAREVMNLVFNPAVVSEGQITDYVIQYILSIWNPSVDSDDNYTHKIAQITSSKPIAEKVLSCINKRFNNSPETEGAKWARVKAEIYHVYPDLNPNHIDVGPPRPEYVGQTELDSYIDIRSAFDALPDKEKKLWRKDKRFVASLHTHCANPVQDAPRGATQESIDLMRRVIAFVSQYEPSQQGLVMKYLLAQLQGTTEESKPNTDFERLMVTDETQSAREEKSSHKPAGRDKNAEKEQERSHEYVMGFLHALGQIDLSRETLSQDKSKRLEKLGRERRFTGKVSRSTIVTELSNERNRDLAFITYIENNPITEEQDIRSLLDIYYSGRSSADMIVSYENIQTMIRNTSNIWRLTSALPIYFLQAFKRKSPNEDEISKFETLLRNDVLHGYIDEARYKEYTGKEFLANVDAEGRKELDRCQFACIFGELIPLAEHIARSTPMIEARVIGRHRRSILHRYISILMTILQENKSPDSLQNDPNDSLLNNLDELTTKKQNDILDRLHSSALTMLGRGSNRSGISQLTNVQTLIFSRQLREAVDSVLNARYYDKTVRHAAVSQDLASEYVPDLVTALKEKITL